MEQMNKWPLCCITSDLDDSIEFHTEKICPAVSEICAPQSLAAARPPVWYNTPPVQRGKGCKKVMLSWWRHQMETFSVLLPICAGNSPVPGDFPVQRPVTRSLDIFFNLRPNKRLSKQWWSWWFETPSSPLWHHCNVYDEQQFIGASHIH